MLRNFTDAFFNLLLENFRLQNKYSLFGPFIIFHNARKDIHKLLCITYISMYLFSISFFIFQKYNPVYIDSCTFQYLH